MDSSEKIDISSLLKARGVFERFRKDMVSDQDKAGAVQAFEFSYELSRRLMGRALVLLGIEVGSPKDVFNKAFLEKLIDDPDLWFEFHSIRNITSHTYYDERVNNVVFIFESFSAELNKLIERLKVLP